MRTTTIAMLLCVTLLVSCAKTEEFDFRDENRPGYENTISLAQLDELSNDPDVTLLDVRLLEDYQANEVLIPGARYMNPENITSWVSELPEDSKVVVYCVAGRWVSQKAAHFLSQQGIETYSLEGGINAWQASQ